MRRSLLILALLLLTACGQAGDLYLPDPEPEAQQPTQPIEPYVPEAEDRKPGRPQGS